MIRYIKKRSETNNVSEDKLSIEETVRSILSDIRERGDAALGIIQDILITGAQQTFDYLKMKLMRRYQN